MHKPTDSATAMVMTRWLWQPWHIRERKKMVDLYMFLQNCPPFKGQNIKTTPPYIGCRRSCHETNV